MVALGYELDATHGTAIVLGEANVPVRLVNKVHEGRPHILDRIKNEEYSYIINTTEGRKAIADSSMIRRTALSNKVFYSTTLAGAKAVCEAIEFGEPRSVSRLQDLEL